MPVQVIHDGIDPLQISRQLGIDPAEKIEKVDLGAPWVALREAVSGRLPQGSEDRALASTTVIQFRDCQVFWFFRTLRAKLYNMGQQTFLRPLSEPIPSQAVLLDSFQSTQSAEEPKYFTPS